jgi:hypothetical protein
VVSTPPTGSEEVEVLFSEPEDAYELPIERLVIHIGKTMQSRVTVGIL